MRLFEVSTLPSEFYHGSSVPLEIGKAYRSRRQAKAYGVDDNVEEYLEKGRPKNALPRNRALFMSDRMNQHYLQNSGAHIDYIYQVEPIGRVERHDVQWLNDLYNVLNFNPISSIDWNKRYMSYSFHMPPIIKSEVPETVDMLVKNYWSGIEYPYKAWSLREYLTPSFRVVKQLKGKGMKRGGAK